jgi:hypothetical protein
MNHANRKTGIYRIEASGLMIVQGNSILYPYDVVKRYGKWVDLRLGESRGGAGGLCARAGIKRFSWERTPRRWGQSKR